MPHRIPSSLLVVLALAACNPEDTVHASNDEPTADITSHADGASVREGDTVVLVGQASDRDDPVDDLLVSWQVNGSEVCAEGPPAADGRSECSTVIEPGEAQVTMLVRDPAEAVGSDTITLTVEESGAPEVEILQPTGEEARLYANVPMDFLGNVSDDEDDAADLDAVWSSDIDAQLDLDGTVLPSGEVKTTGLLKEGTHNLTLTVTDSDDKVGKASVSVTVLPDNRAPECVITEPTSGASGEAGSAVTVRASATDADMPNEELKVVLESDLGGVLSVEPPTTDGTVTFSTSDLAQGTHRILLTATDDVGETCVEEVLYTVGQPPLVAITSPADGTVMNEGGTATFEGTVADGDDALSDVKIEWSSDLDGVLSTEPSDSFGNIGVVRSGLSQGTHVIAVKATDPKGLYHIVRQDFVVNGLPTAPVVSVSPDPAATLDDLSVSIDTPAADPESDPITYSYQWFRDGVAIGSATSALLPASDTSKNHTYKVDVTPDDGHGTGPTASAERDVLNTPPTVVAPALSPASPNTSDDIACTPGAMADADADPISLNYAWTINGTLSTTKTATMPAADTSRGDEVVCSTTPNDGEEDGLAVSSGKVTVSNSAPSLASASISPADAVVTDELVCSWSGWLDADSDKDVSTVEWKVGGKVIGTAAKLTTGFKKGDTVTCEVTPYDGTDSGSMVSAKVTVGNSAPEIATASVSPTGPKAGDTLTCSYAGFKDADGDSDLSTYRWTADGKDIGTAKTQKGGFVKDDVVVCYVTPYDGTDEGVVVDDSTVVNNTAPAITGVSISPSKATVDDDLTCAWSGYSDADSDADKSTVQWLIGGKVIGTGATLSSGYSKNDKVECRVTPNDGEDDGTPLTTGITIDNSVPKVSSLTLTPGSIATDGTLTANAVGTDADGDKVTFTYAWYIDGSAISPTSKTLDGKSWFDRDEEVQVKVVPSDGTVKGTEVASSIVTVKNTAPSIKGVTVTPASPKVTDRLTCVATGYADADADLDRSTLEWIIDGKVVGTGKSLVSGFDKDDKVSCRVTPFDGTDKGTALTSTVTVLNTVPVITSVTLSPTKPYTVNPIVATTVWDDEDGDKVTLSYVWRIDGVVSKATGATLASSYTSKGESVTVTVTADDGDGKSKALASSAVKVLNTIPSITSVTITPPSATVADSATCGWTGFADADLDTDRSTIAWKLGGKTIATTAKLGLGSYAKGDVLTCEVTPYDGTDRGTMRSSTLTIKNATPAMTAVSLTPSKVYTSGTLTAAASATDADKDRLTYAYTWYVNKSKVAVTGAVLDGAKWFDRGDTVQVGVTATDGSATSPTMDSAVITVLNSVPSIKTVSMTPGRPTASDTVTCSTTGYADADGDKSVPTYAWYKNGVLEKGGGSTFPGSFKRGDKLECRATANDGLDTGNTLSLSVTAVNAYPKITSVTVGPDPLKTLDVANISFTATDADGDKVTFDRATWTVAGKTMTETGSSLAGKTYFNKGQDVVATLTVTDGNGGKDSATAAKVVVVNSAPTAAALTLSPSPFQYQVDRSLQCIVGAAADDDLDRLTYSVSWFRNGTAVTTLLSTTVIKNDTIAGFHMAPGDEFECSVVANDGSVDGPEASAFVDVHHKVGWAGTMAPCSAKFAAGGSFTSKSKVWLKGVTDAAVCDKGPTDPACIAKQKELDFEFGVGPDGSDPTKTLTGWTFTPGTLNSKVGNDWIVTHLHSSAKVGVYDFAWRYSADGGLSWEYADLYEDDITPANGCKGTGDGTTDGYSASDAGDLVVTK